MSYKNKSSIGELTSYKQTQSEKQSVSIFTDSPQGIEIFKGFNKQNINMVQSQSQNINIDQLKPQSVELNQKEFILIDVMSLLNIGYNAITLDGKQGYVIQNAVGVNLSNLGVISTGDNVIYNIVAPIALGDITSASIGLYNKTHYQSQSSNYAMINNGYGSEDVADLNIPLNNDYVYTGAYGQGEDPSFGNNPVIIIIDKIYKSSGFRINRFSYSFNTYPNPALGYYVFDLNTLSSDDITKIDNTIFYDPNDNCEISYVNYKKWEVTNSIISSEDNANKLGGAGTVAIKRKFTAPEYSRITNSSKIGDIDGNYSVLYKDNNSVLSFKENNLLLEYTYKNTTTKYISTEVLISPSDIISIKKVLNETSYISFVIKYIGSDTVRYLYIALRDTSQFESTAMPTYSGINDFHLIVISDDLSINFSDYPESSDPVNSGTTLSYSDYKHLVDISKITLSHIGLFGTRDILLKTNEVSRTHRYGENRIDVVNGGWFDQSIIVGSDGEFNFNLSSTVQPNFFQRYTPVRQRSLHNEYVDYYVANDITAAPGGYSIVYYNTLKLENNKYSALLPAIQEKYQYNPAIDFIEWGGNFLLVANTYMVQHGTTLYLSSQIGTLMPHPHQPILSGFTNYYSVGSYIVATNNNTTQLYSYNQRDGVALIYSVEGECIAKPMSYSQSIYLLTKIDTEYSVYKIEQGKGVLKVFSKDRNNSVTSSIGFYLKGKAIFGVVTSTFIDYILIGNGISLYSQTKEFPSKFIETVYESDGALLSVVENDVVQIKQISFDIANSFTIESQLINLIQPGKQFILTSINVDADTYPETDSISISITINNTTTNLNITSLRTSVGSINVDTIKYSLTANTPIRSIKLEGYYMEV